MSKRKNKASSDTPSKRDRPGGEEEEEEEEEDDDDDVVGPTQQDSQLSQRTAAEVGIVESITLKNFMCHSLLGPCSFGPNVNFVVGNNGSGKSAILTALIVVLSGNAQATNRGSSLKGFVKEGESSADVSVTLRNRGKDAYKPEVYGQSVVVDLRITREGSRTYKLKTKSGHIVSSRKEDLLSVLDHFNIQVNNPVSILTQEMSKHFLNSKGEGHKYRFFMKATQLEQLKEDFVHIKSTKNVTQDLMEQHKETLAAMKKNYLEKEDLYKSLASLDVMQAELEDLNGQMAWAQVGEMERAVEPVRQKLESDERNTVKFDQKVDEWKDKTAEAERKYKEIHDQLDVITLRLQELQPQGAALKAEAQRLTNPLKAAEAAVHRCKTNLRDLEKDKTQLASRIDELKLSISQTTGADSQVRVERLEQLQAELDALQHQDSTLDQQIDQYQQASNRAKDEFGKMRREQDVLQVSLDNGARNLHNMESSRNNRLRRFGEQMPALLDAIRDAHERRLFKQRPRGPLGFLISLKEPELALAVEVCLKGQLLAFTCDNYEDERVLQGLMSRLFPAARRPSIITSSFLPHVHDTSRRAVDHPKYPSVLQALEIDDPVVANCLIDQSRIECILLIKNRTEARQVMQGRNPPKNCTQAFSKDGDTIYTDRTYTSDQSRPNYLTGDVEEEIRHMQAELANQQSQASRFEQHIRKVEDDRRQNDTLLKSAHMEQKKTKDKIRKLQMEIADQQNVEEPQSEDLNPLEEELQEVITKISSQRVEFEEARAQMAQAQASCEEAERQYRQHKDQISSVAEEADPIKDGLCTSDQEVAKCKHHKKHYEDKRKAHLSSIQTLITSLHSKQEELTTTIAKATEVCPERVEVSRTAKTLDSEISRLKAKISSQHEQQGDPEEITRQYHEAMESYKEVFQHRRSLLKFITSLEIILEDRQRAYNDLRKFLSVRCKYYFDNMLAQRGFSGSMIFDHKQEALSITVQPGQGDKAGLSDMRSLSGGERSFSTVCFVLSLWAIAEAPFRCLDEFDVYMDMVNRRISMDMMLKVAASQRYRQFIFLTPQSMSNLPVNSMIRILRLNDPDRGQRTLPFGQPDGEAED